MNMDHLYPAYATEKLLVFSLNKVNTDFEKLRYKYPRLLTETESNADINIKEQLDIIDFNMDKMDFKLSYLNAWFKNHEEYSTDTCKRIIDDLDQQEVIIKEINEVIDNIYSIIPVPNNAPTQNIGE